jgi:4,5-dihydroxyphthalate decarboxylase
MSQLKLAIATTDYDHFRDFQLGLVRAEGIDHNWLTLGHHEIFARFTFNREWDVVDLRSLYGVINIAMRGIAFLPLRARANRFVRSSRTCLGNNSALWTLCPH